jgi:hypothetical protein
MVGNASRLVWAEFDAPFQVLFSGLCERALGQEALLLSSPGTLVSLEKRGHAYLYWRAYHADGKRRDLYLGREDEAATQEKAEQARARMVEARELADTSRALRAQGYAAADNSAAITLAALFNAGFFRQGALLVGTHAFGVILNTLGVRLRTNYSTEDIDLARYDRIKVALKPDEAFVDLLRSSGLPFLEVPELDLAKPATSFKVRGRKLKVDLLVPGDERYRSVAIPELGVHATALPYLGYLLEQSTQGVVLGRDHVVPVRIPNAARYAIHKLIVATLRMATAAAKADKDLMQAATVVAVLADRFEDELTSAVRALPARARGRVARSARRAADLVAPQHAAAEDFLRGLAKRVA